FLWIAEGLSTVLQNIELNAFTDYDILIFTETFNLNNSPLIPNFYCFEGYATKTEHGRPSGGISCYINPEIVLANIVYQDCSAMVLSKKTTYIALCNLKPTLTATDIVHTISLCLS